MERVLGARVCRPVSASHGVSDTRLTPPTALPVSIVRRVELHRLHAYSNPFVRVHEVVFLFKVPHPHALALVAVISPVSNELLAKAPHLLLCLRVCQRTMTCLLAARLGECRCRRRSPATLQTAVVNRASTLRVCVLCSPRIRSGLDCATLPTSTSPTNGRNTTALNFTLTYTQPSPASNWRVTTSLVHGRQRNHTRARWQLSAGCREKSHATHQAATLLR